MDYIQIAKLTWDVAKNTEVSKPYSRKNSKGGQNRK